jgi:hypothetical protein
MPFSGIAGNAQFWVLRLGHLALAQDDRVKDKAALRRTIDRSMKEFVRRRRRRTGPRNEKLRS